MKNDYDHPDTKLLDMGDDGTLMVFLQNDDTKSDAEFTSLSYVVYKNGEFVTEPVKIQTDKTADFQPDLTSGGAIDQSTIVRLTDDESYPLGGETQFFDADPKIAYDEASGSYCIYYVKTGYDKNAKLKSPTEVSHN